MVEGLKPFFTLNDEINIPIVVEAVQIATQILHSNKCCKVVLKIKSNDTTIKDVNIELKVQLTTLKKQL